MRIFVKAKTKAKEEKVVTPLLELWSDKKEDRIELAVYVKEPPIQGRANMAILKALAKHFNISPSQIKLISGASSKQKVFEID